MSDTNLPYCHLKVGKWEGLEGLGLGEVGCAGKTVMVANLLQFPQKSYGCFLLPLSLLMSHIAVGVLQSTWHLCPCALPSRSELINFSGEKVVSTYFFLAEESSLPP